MYKFTQYESCDFALCNQGYYNKLKKLGVEIDLTLPKVTEQEVKEFLDKKYYSEIIPVAPVRSCSILCQYEPLIKQLEELFACKVYTIYGYVKTSVKNYHYFDDAAIRRGLSGKIFDNHHAWFQFKNGQLLDLVFINTLRAAKGILNEKENKFEFILAKDGSTVSIPNVMSIVEKISQNSFFNYIPMYNGKLFNSNDLLHQAIESNNMVVWGTN